MKRTPNAGKAARPLPPRPRYVRMWADCDDWMMPVLTVAKKHLRYMRRHGYRVVWVQSFERDPSRRGQGRKQP